MELVALIPARGGSKGIPRKNMVMLAGRPLIDYTIVAAKTCGVVDRTICTSDDSDIIYHCQSMGIDTIQRPAELAADETPMAPVICHALDELRRRTGKQPRWLVLLQPTSPLRVETDIARAYDLLRAKNARTVISVSEPASTPYKALVEDAAGYIKGLVNDDAPFMRRQDCPRVYFANGAIYIFSVEDFQRHGRIDLERAVAYVMPDERSIDIDTLDDLMQVEGRL